MSTTLPVPGSAEHDAGLDRVLAAIHALDTDADQ